MHPPKGDYERASITSEGPKRMSRQNVREHAPSLTDHRANSTALFNVTDTSTTLALSLQDHKQQHLMQQPIHLLQLFAVMKTPLGLWNLEMRVTKCALQTNPLPGDSGK